MPRFSLMPREEKFFNLFEESSKNLVKAAQLLVSLMTSGEEIEGKVKQMTDFEHEGDAITHQIVDQLRRTFVTPFDREDIMLLVHGLDDILDFIHAAADAMLIYNVTEPTERAAELAAVVVEAVLEVEKAVSCLRHRKRLREILEHCIEINRLENRADRVVRQALAELFNDSKPVTDVIMNRLPPGARDRVIKGRRKRL